MMTLTTACRDLRLVLEPSTVNGAGSTGRSGSFRIEQGGQRAGRVSLVETGANSADISYGIEPEFRRQGLATRAVAAVLIEAKKLGFHVVSAQCRSNNVASRRILERARFLLHSTAPFSTHEQDVAVLFMVYQWTAVSPERDPSL